MRRSTFRLILGVVTALFALVVASCGSSGTGPRDRIDIGVMVDCFGVFPQWADPSVAGAQLPLLVRGGERAGADLYAGVKGVTIGQMPVELVFACTGDTSYDALVKARQLVEGQGVDIVIGPTGGTQGLALRDYAKRHPGVSFVSGTAAAQSTTLREPASNLFRFTTDGAQWSAGLGSYAFNELGWRTAIVVARDFDFGYTEAGGFIAEFCSLGGKITERIYFAFPLESETFLSELPSSGFDGAYVEDAEALLVLGEQHAAFAGSLADKVVGSVLTIVDEGTIRELGDRASGVVAGVGPFPLVGSPTTPEWDAFANGLKEAFPELVAAGEAAGDPDFLVNSLFPVTYFNAMEATLQALEAVEGDLADGQSRFREALAATELDSPIGRIRLDKHRQAVAPNYLMQIEATADGSPAVGVFRVLEGVEQTFNGYFAPDSPPPGRTEPECKQGDPPQWAVDGN